MNMKFKLSGEFGELSEVRDHVHNGIDLAMPNGTTLRSIAEGVVTKIFDGSADIGQGVAIKLNNGTTHIYGHMNGVKVKVGEHLNAGDVIGLSGNTGNSTGPHLHFGVQLPDGNFVDPTKFAEDLSAMSGTGQINSFKHADFNLWDWFAQRGKVNQYNDSVKSGENPFWNWVQIELHDLLSSMWSWFILNLPDIIGYLTITAGIGIILGAMIGRGGMMKVLGWYAGILIIAICILGGV